MAGPHILAARQGQAMFAGNTRAAGEANPGAPAPPSAVEALNLSSLRSELDHITAGGWHPESIWEQLSQPLNRGLEVVSSQLRGPNGGAIPKPYSHAMPGPAGEGLAARGRALLARLGLMGGPQGG